MTNQLNQNEDWWQHLVYKKTTQLANASDQILWEIYLVTIEEKRESGHGQNTVGHRSLQHAPTQGAEALSHVALAHSTVPGLAPCAL